MQRAIVVNGELQPLVASVRPRQANAYAGMVAQDSAVKNACVAIIENMEDPARSAMCVSSSGTRPSVNF